MESGICSAKFDHSYEHFETKESQENPRNSVSNDIFSNIIH